MRNEDATSSKADATSKMQEAISKAIDDAFPDNLKKTPYTDGWPENKWMELIEQHPLFMTKSPDPSEELPPLLEGIQQLKYGDDENTPDELASTYKDDGNFYFKCKKYRDASISYSAGLKQNCSNELKAQLFNNRSAAQFYLKNYRSAFNDCEEALKLNPEHMKVKIRSAQCLFHLRKFKECIDRCDDILSQEEDNNVIKRIKKDAIAKQKIEDRNLRKESKKEKEKLAMDDMVLKMIRDRKVNLHLPGNKDLLKISDLDPPDFVPSYVERVHLEGDQLVWPVVYIFPEYTLNIPIMSPENLTLKDILRSVYPDMLEYDHESKYLTEELNVYGKNKNGEAVPFPADAVLTNVLCDPKYFFSTGVPVFIIVLKGSKTEQQFLKICKPS